MTDYSQERFIVKREIRTEMVYQDPVTGSTRRELNMQMELKQPASLPVLASEHDRNNISFINNPSLRYKAEPIRDPNLEHPGIF
jgi:hypothetical protein